MKSLQIQDVSVRFGKVQALNKVAIELASGSTLMLVGPNGAGKSTLIKVLLGLVRPDSGALKVDGKASRVDRAFRTKIGYLPEAIAFSENLTGRQVLNFFTRARGLPKRRTDEVLERVGLAHAKKRAVRGYSRGMRQRLGLAQAIVGQPQLLILDEPTGGLDQEGLSVLWSVLEEWREKGRMVLLSAHDLAVMERRVTKMVVLRAGKVLTRGTPNELRAEAALPHRVHFEVADSADRSALAKEAAKLGKVSQEDNKVLVEVVPDKLLELMDVRAKFASSVVGIRVQEAPLDRVYEHLLEGTES